MTHAPSTTRQLGVAVALCLLGAGLAGFSATRQWAVEVTGRAAGLPELRQAVTGGGAVPWLPALAWAGMAGAGALPATRGAVRRLLGVLLVVAGAGLILGTGRAVLLVEPQGAAWGWPLAGGLGAVAVVSGGLLAALRGHRWPGMGARYDRAPTRSGAGGSGRSGGADGSGGPGAAGSPGGPGGAGAGGQPRGDEPVVTRDAWEALDRGEDPTLT